MQTPGVLPETLQLIDRMTGPPPSHPRFTGEPVDLTRIDAIALGDLWAVAHAVELRKDDNPVQTLAADTARAVLDLGRNMEPAFRGSACRDYLDFLAREEERTQGQDKGFFADRPWRNACFALARCIDLSFEGLGAAARRFLAASNWRTAPHVAVALARLVDESFAAQALEKLALDLAGSPQLVAELRAAARLDLPTHIEIAKAVHFEGGDFGAIGETHPSLADLPAYVSFAKSGLEQAAERVRRIHHLELPYAADKAFTLEESAVIDRLVRVALDRDEPWLPPILDELFRKVSRAPTAAKTVPSQSVAIALGHAIEAFPTPEAVATLRAVLRDIRHAGVKKKLQRNVRGAERGLANRPEVALRLPVDQAVSKTQLTTLTRSLEGSLTAGLTLSYEDWCARLALHPQAKGLAGALLWRISDAAGQRTSVLPVADRGRLTLQDVDGATIPAGPDCTVTLWHPVDATTAERDAWRDRLVALRIKQPFKQAFREHYAVPFGERSNTKTAMFSGHIVSIVPLLGLSRRERWELEYDSLSRTFGPWLARLDLADHIYPGCVGATTTGHLGLWSSGGKTLTPARLGDVPAATLSEILRAVDLLVSVSGFAVDADGDDLYRDSRLQRLAEGKLGAMAEMRKQALERALSGLDGMAGLEFDARHLRLGPYAIHLATGRVTRDGEPVTIDKPAHSKLAALPWLPYDEKLLEAIVCAAIEIAGRLNGNNQSEWRV